jgi:ABC-2 type transport system permease protein
MTWQELLVCEIKATFTNTAVLLTVFGGVILYSFLYPIPYSQQLPRDQSVVLVDLDNSAVSRQLIRMVNATPQVHINRHVYSISAAQQAIVEENLAGMLVIPKNFYRDLLLGHSPTLSYAGDATYFLVYSTVIEGLATAGATLAAEVKVVHQLIEEQPLVSAKQQYNPIHLNLKPVFNVTTGYINYVVPAVFVLILYQTLLIGIALLGTTQKEMDAEGKKGYWQQVPQWKLMLTRSFIFLIIYTILCLYYFGFSFDYYVISKLAEPLLLFQLMIPFLLATCFFGIFIGQLLPRRELVTAVILLTSLPIVFSAGFVWPINMLPEPLVVISQIFPAIPAIQAFLQINQMGADFSQISILWQQLWLQTLIYGVFSLWLTKKRLAKKKHIR